MEAVIINAEEWRTLLHKIDRITAFIEQSAEQPQTDSSVWLNDEEVGELLKISTKTLYRLRKSGDISYSSIAQKHYYRKSDIWKLMEKRAVKSTNDHISGLRNCQKLKKRNLGK